MNNTSAIPQNCGQCGGPILNMFVIWIEAVPYHSDCCNDWFHKQREADIAEITRLREQLAEAERQRDAARTEALEDAAQCCDTEADRCDDAAKWGGSRRYISDCKAAAYAMRNRAAAIRALIKEDRT